jgi:hypothetical protein
MTIQGNLFLEGRIQISPQITAPYTIRIQQNTFAYEENNNCIEFDASTSLSSALQYFLHSFSPSPVILIFDRVGGNCFINNAASYSIATPGVSIDDSW